MAEPGYIPKVWKFFSNNRGEVLTKDDIMMKFQLSHSEVDRCVKILTEAGVLRRTQVYQYNGEEGEGEGKGEL